MCNWDSRDTVTQPVLTNETEPYLVLALETVMKLTYLVFASKTVYFHLRTNSAICVVIGMYATISCKIETLFH